MTGAIALGRSSIVVQCQPPLRKPDLPPAVRRGLEPRHIHRGLYYRHALKEVGGVSAIDKLNQAGLLAYRDDDHIHMNPSLARGFYQYLRELHSVVAPGGPGRNQ